MGTLVLAMILLGPMAQGPKELKVPEVVKPPLVVAEGTVIPVSLITEISTEHAKPGDGIYARTIFPVTVNNEIVIPVDTYVRGRVVNAERPGRVKGKAELTINFHTLVMPSGLTLPIFGSLGGAGGTNERRGEATVVGEASKGEDAGTIGTTTVTGAGVGGIGARSVGGAVIGAGIGAAAGVAQVLFGRGKDLVLTPGTTLEIVLDRPIEP